MNKYSFTVLGLFLLFNFGMTQLQAAEGSEYVDALLNNQYLIENARLIGLAEESYDEGKYDDAIEYANQAIQYAQLSDEFVALQLKIREASDAINTAEARLNWAKAIRTPAETYEKAETAFEEAVDAFSEENWDVAKESALRVLAILADLPETPVLPAQYLVKSWISTRDCLWNIAGKPEIYGDPWQWRRIYTANRDKLPRPNDPDLIHPGMILDIPSIRGEIRSGIMEE